MNNSNDNDSNNGQKSGLRRTRRQDAPEPR
jgi:hypothetical protein